MFGSTGLAIVARGRNGACAWAKAGHRTRAMAGSDPIRADPRTRRGVSRRVGLLGGSFDPPHEGHLHVTLAALRSLRVQSVWWLVSPGNPLKDAPGASLEHRIRASRTLVGRYQRVSVSDMESRLGTRHTVDLLRRLSIRAPSCRFVWIMGADNLAVFHKWKAWPEIFLRIPIAVMPRPGSQVRAGLSLAARRFARFRVPPRAAAGLALHGPPRWCLLGGPLQPASSSRIRAMRE